MKKSHKKRVLKRVSCLLSSVVLGLSATVPVMLTTAVPMGISYAEEQAKITVKFDLSDPEITYPKNVSPEDFADQILENSNVAAIPAGYIAKKGYTFCGWTLDGFYGYAPGDTAVVEGATEVVFKPVFFDPTNTTHKLSYTFTLDGQEGERPEELEDGKFCEGQLVTPNEAMLHFGDKALLRGWTVDDKEVPLGKRIIMPDHDLTAVPIWARYVNVTYDAGGVDRLVGNESFTFTKTEGMSDELAAKDRISRKGFTISGWVSSYDGKTYKPLETVAAPPVDVVYTAVWEPLNYNVVFKSGVSGVTNQKVSGKTDTAIVCPEINTTRAGYTFMGWKYTDDNGEEAVYGAGQEFVVPGAIAGKGITLEAVWAEGENLTVTTTQPKVTATTATTTATTTKTTMTTTKPAGSVTTPEVVENNYNIEIPEEYKEGSYSIVLEGKFVDMDAQGYFMMKMIDDDKSGPVLNVRSRNADPVADGEEFSVITREGVDKLELTMYNMELGDYKFVKNTVYEKHVEIPEEYRSENYSVVAKIKADSELPKQYNYDFDVDTRYNESRSKITNDTYPMIIPEGATSVDLKFINAEILDISYAENTVNKFTVDVPEEYRSGKSDYIIQVKSVENMSYITKATVVGTNQTSGYRAASNTSSGETYYLFAIPEGAEQLEFTLINDEILNQGFGDTSLSGSTTGTTPSGTSTTETTTTATGDAGAGDANLDGKVSIADAVAILQYIANSDEYSLTEKAQKNADVCGTGDGVNTSDALAIQMLDAGTIEALPVEKLPE